MAERREMLQLQGLRGISPAKPTAEFVQLSQTRCQIWTAIPRIPARYYNDGGCADCRQKLMSDPIPERCAGDRPASQIRGVGGVGGRAGKGRHTETSPTPSESSGFRVFAIVLLLARLAMGEINGGLLFRGILLGENPCLTRVPSNSL